MNIELYSVKGFTGNVLLHKLEQALEQHHMPFSVSEINHVDQFIKAGLSSVPAFKIGNEVIQHPHDALPEETVEKVITYLRERALKSILIPVDFSPHSVHAVSYGCMIAHYLEMGVTLTHVHQVIADPISAGALDIHFLQDSKERLSKLVEKVREENDKSGWIVPVDAHMEIGETSSSLLQLLDADPYEMMIIGTRADPNVVRHFWGTVSSEVSRLSHKPVWVVPPEAEIRFPGKVVVGFTEELILDGALEYILQFGSKNDVFFDFVHITDDVREFNRLKNKLFEKLVVNRNMLCGFNIRSMSEDQRKIHEILYDYADSARAGMVILVSHHRNFFENITHSSVTKKALREPRVPVMIIHRDAE